MMDYLPL